MTEACSQVTSPARRPRDRGPPLSGTRVRVVAGRRDPRRRADRRARASGVLRTGDLGALDERGRLRHRAQGGHDRHRRRERRARGGRGRARGAPAVAEAAVFGRARRRVGGGDRRRVVPARRARADRRRAARALRRAPRRLQGPEGDRVRRRALPRTASGKLLRRQLGTTRAPTSAGRSQPRRSDAAGRGLVGARRANRRPAATPVSRVAASTRRLDAAALGPCGEGLGARAAINRDGRSLASPRMRPGTSLAAGRQHVRRRARRQVITDGSRSAPRGACLRQRRENVQVRQMEAEWLDQPAATVDAVLCRWGYMLLADARGGAARGAPRAAAGRRRIALAAWEPIESIPGIGDDPRAGRARHCSAPATRAPGEVRAGRARRRRGSARGRRLRRHRHESVDFVFRAESLDAWWDHTRTVVGARSPALDGLPPRRALRAARRRRHGLAEWVADEGRWSCPRGAGRRRRRPASPTPTRPTPAAAASPSRTTSTIPTAAVRRPGRSQYHLRLASPATTRPGVRCASPTSRPAAAQERCGDRPRRRRSSTCRRSRA